MKAKILLLFLFVSLLSCKKEEPEPIEDPIQDSYSIEEIYSTIQGTWINDSSITYYNGVGGSYGYYPENPNDTVEVDQHTWHKYGGFTSEIGITENNIYFYASGATWHVDTLLSNRMILSMTNGYTYINHYGKL
jgi:hypothetical protein